MREEKADAFFTKEEESRIVAAIKAAELKTSGEIRVHLENKDGGDSYQRAKKVFEEAGMTKTELRNGVLFYLAIQDHHFSILGDKGIYEKVGPGFWDEIKAGIEAQFKQGNFVEGLEEGILKAGSALKAHFPRQDDDINELPDQISKSD